MEILLYPIIVFLATALGATSGAGGGAIIKPVFDGIGLIQPLSLAFILPSQSFLCAWPPSTNTEAVGWCLIRGFSMDFPWARC